MKKFEISNIAGFRSKDKFYAIDYIISKKDQSIDFLKQGSIVLMTIMRDTNLQQIKQKRININSFQILQMIGLGGFSKVFLGKQKY